MMKQFLSIILALALSFTAEARNTPTDTVQYSTQGSAPSSPVAGTVYDYFLTSDGFPYFKNSGGSVYGYLYSSSALTNHGVMLGAGTRQPTVMSVCSSNTVFVGNTGADPSCRTLVNADFNASAGINWSKMEALTSAHILVGSAGNVATDVAMSGDVAISNTGATTIQNSAVTNAKRADMAQATVSGRASGAGTGAPTDLSSSQLNTIAGLSDLFLTKAFGISDTNDSSTGNIDALDTTNVSSIRLTGAAPVIRGIEAGTAGQLLVLINAAGTSVSVKNQDANPTAANKIITGTGTDLSLADSASIFLKYDGTTQRWRIIGGSGSGGGSGDSMAMTVTQSSHGFAVGDILYYTGSTWAKAKADAASTAEALGIVSAVPTANSFTLTMGGNVTTLSGLTAGTVYFVSDSSAGAYTATEPTNVGYVSKPIMVAYSTTEAVVLNMRGQVITAAAGGGVSTFTYTPSLTASTSNPSLGTSPPSQRGVCTRIDQRLICDVYLQFGSSSSSAGSGTYRISLPSGLTLGTKNGCGATMNIAPRAGWGSAYDDSGGTYLDTFYPYCGTAGDAYVQMRQTNVSTTVTNSSPWTWANNDVLAIHYEVFIAEYGGNL